MTARNSILAGTLAALAAGVAASATAQEPQSYVVVEDHGNYSAPPLTYYAPPLTVERRRATEDFLVNEDVKAALAADPRLDPRSIAVETNRNVVSLSGLVNLPGQAIIAQRDASQVNGVSEVRNNLRSRVGDPTSY